MTALLEKAMADASKLSEEMQDLIASRILDTIEDEQWASVTPEKRNLLQRMADEAIEEHRRGETIPLDDLLK